MQGSGDRLSSGRSCYPLTILMSHFLSRLPPYWAVVELRVCFSLFPSHFPPELLCFQLSFCCLEPSTVAHSSLAAPSTLPLSHTAPLPLMGTEYQALPLPMPAAPNESSTFILRPPLPPIFSYLNKAQIGSSDFFQSHKDYSKQQQ